VCWTFPLNIYFTPIQNPLYSGFPSHPYQHCPVTLSTQQSQPPGNNSTPFVWATSTTNKVNYLGNLYIGATSHSGQHLCLGNFCIRSTIENNNHLIIRQPFDIQRLWINLQTGLDKPIGTHPTLAVPASETGALI